jgi:hypothetical protein
MKNACTFFLTLIITLSGMHSATALEQSLTDEERSIQSAAVLEGTVISTKFLKELKVGALYSAQIRVDSVEKGQPDLKADTVIFYEQTYTGKDAQGLLTGMHGRLCPGYPVIKVGQKVKVWCIRQTTEDYKDALFIPTSSWAKQPK